MNLPTPPRDQNDRHFFRVAMKDYLTVEARGLELAVAALAVIAGVVGKVIDLF